MFGAISEKFCTFDMQINFAILPIFHLRRWLGEFFSLFQSYEILSLYQSIRCVIIGHFTTVPSYLGDFEVSPISFGDSSKDVGDSLKIIGGSPMSLKDLWRPDWTAGSRQCQGHSRCRTRGHGQGSTSAMPRY